MSDNLDTVAKCTALLNNLRACGLFGDSAEKRIQLGENSKNILDMFISSILMRMYELSFKEEKGEEKEEEKNEEISIPRYAPYLIEVGPKVIEVVKKIRDITNLSLKEVKEIVDKARSGHEQLIPIIINNSRPEDNLVTENHMTVLKKSFESAGASISFLDHSNRKRMTWSV